MTAAAGRLTAFESGKAWQMENVTAIKSALESLLLQSDEALPFALIEHKESGTFVQFTGSKSHPLLLDVPWQALSEAEFYRAVTFFRRRCSTHLAANLSVSS